MRPASKNRRPAVSKAAGGGVRLQKALADAGLGSRRRCEELILEGRVEVDRQVVSELGTRVDSGRQEIRVDGEPLKRGRRLYFAVNKPTGVVSTNRDPSGRPRVVDLVASHERLFTVGRLDASSEGLILVTNDGELSNELAHPRYGVEKIYQVEVAGEPTREQLDQLRHGVYLAEGVVRIEQLQVKKRFKKSTLLEMTLSEGKNREIRRAMARIGHKVLRLKRIAIGPVRLGDLPTGAFRPLSVQEVRRLREFASSKGKGKRAAGGERRRKGRGAKPAGRQARTGAEAGSQEESRGQAGSEGHAKSRQAKTRGGGPSGRKPAHGQSRGGKPRGKSRDSKPQGTVLGYDEPQESMTAGAAPRDAARSRSPHAARSRGSRHGSAARHKESHKPGGKAKRKPRR